MGKTLYLALAFGMSLTSALGASTDYSSLEGKQGAALKEAVKAIALPHTEISYGEDSWDVFAKADVRMIDGKEAWFDMYSNRLVYVADGHAQLNIEHAVANSWWGGVKNAAYKDIHHLNPSDADANGRKSNHPLGEIDGYPTWSNGLTNIGRPVMGQGGGASTVFEPADEFKGDFARAYFYIFTLYDNIGWADSPACMYDLSAYPTLKPWAYELLLKWAAEDPVDEREAARNNAVAEAQKNENPFVAIPGLAEYVWGAKKNTPFSLKDAMTAPLANRPDAPAFGDYYLVGVNTWTGRWWDSFTLSLSAPAGCDIYYTLTDSGEYQLYEGGVVIGGASKAGDVVNVKAYAVDPSDPLERRSSVATLTLTAVEEGQTDYMHARWQKVRSAQEINDKDLYIIVSSTANAVMSTNIISSSSSVAFSVAGNATPSDDIISILPEGSAVVQLVPAGGGEYYVQVNTLALESKGFMMATAAKKLTLSDTGMPAEVTLNPDRTVTIDLGSTYGKVQYNASSPRFSVYTSKQQGINLYRCIENASSNVSAPELPSSSGESGAASRIFTFDGTELGVPESSLPAGLYLIVKDGRARKLLKR